MRKVKLYIAASLDGYIARSDGDLEWLTEHSNPDELDYGYEEFYSTIDAVVMGRATYESILEMGGEWPYKDKVSYIATRQESLKSILENLHFTTEKMEELVASLQGEKGKDIWLVGGGELVATFLEHNLINTMIITYIPIILGSGIPLFQTQPTMSEWDVMRCEAYDNNVVQIEYQIKE